MINQKIKFVCDDNLQMKTIALLIQKASIFQAHIYLLKGERRANAKSLLGVMSLGMENNDEITITADGPDEEEACAELAEYLNVPHR